MFDTYCVPDSFCGTTEAVAWRYEEGLYAMIDITSKCEGDEIVDLNTNDENDTSSNDGQESEGNHTFGIALVISSILFFGFIIFKIKRNGLKSLTRKTKLGKTFKGVDEQTLVRDNV
jgi:hypothetical protein